MTDDFVGIDIQGWSEIKTRLDKLPPEAQDAGVESANAYIVKKEQAYIPYKYVSMKQARVPLEARRKVAILIRKGIIKVPYRRTQTLRRGWKTVGAGRNQIIVNEVKYAPFVKAIKSQTMGHMLRGWDVIQNDLEKWTQGIVKQFEEGVKRAISNLRLDG